MFLLIVAQVQGRVVRPISWGRRLLPVPRADGPVTAWGYPHVLGGQRVVISVGKHEPMARVRSC